MHSLSEKSLPRHLNEQALKSIMMNNQDNKNTAENQQGLERLNRDESASNQDPNQSKSNLRLKSDEVQDGAKNLQLPSKTKLRATLGPKNHEKSDFTDHRDNSKLFEETICAKLERFRTVLEKSHKVKTTPFPLKNIRLSPGQVNLINQTFKNLGLADIETQHNQKKKKPFQQENNFEIDFLFVVEPSLTSNDPAPKEVEEEVMSDFIVTLPVPSIVMFEITLDSTKEMMSKKIVQLARNALLLRKFPETFFDYKGDTDNDTLEPMHPFSNYPLILILISNNDVILGAHHFLEEYCQLAQHQSFANLMSKVATIPTIKVTPRALDEIAPIIEKQRKCGLHIGQMPVYSIYAQNLENFEKRLYSLEHRYQESVTQFNRQIVDLDKKISTQIDDLDKKIDKQIVDLDKKIDKHIVDLDKKIDKQIVDLDKKIDKQIVDLEKKMDANFAEMRFENEKFYSKYKLEFQHDLEKLHEGLVKIEGLLLNSIVNKQATIQAIIQTDLPNQNESQPKTEASIDIEKKADKESQE